VENASPKLLEIVSSGGRLEDMVSPEDVRAWTYLSYVGKPVLLVIGLVFGLPLAIAIWSGDANTIQLIAALLLLFGGGFVLLLSLQAWVTASQHRSRLPRTVKVEAGQLEIAAPERTETAELKDCTWYYGKTFVDEVCLYSGLRQGVVIHTPETTIGCGHSPEVLECWQAFLTLARVPQNPPLGCLRGFAITMAGVGVGLFAGIAIGALVWTFTRHPAAVFAIGFLGFLDGGFATGVYCSATSEGWRAARKRLSPMVLGLAFAVVGANFGNIFGIPGLIIFAIANGGIGVIVGWACRTRIRAAQLDREAEQYNPFIGEV